MSRASARSGCGITAKVALFGILCSGIAHAEGEAASPGEHPPIHPVPTEELRPHAPSPQWNTGLLLGVCGVGESSFWEGTDFCAGALGELHFFRRRYADFGFGPYAQIGTSGFFDFRASLGGSLHVPLGKLSLGARLGGYLHTDGNGASPGAEGFLDVGLRNLNFTGHYALTHTLSVGLQVTPDDSTRRDTTFWIAARIDGFWLALPFGMML